MKDELRRQLLTKRSAMDKDMILSKSSVISQRLLTLDEFQTAKTVLFYTTLGSEVSTENLKDNEKIIGIPLHVSKGTLTIRTAQGEEKLLKPEDVDLVIIPGVGFDKQKNRLGRGKGFYDRFLAEVTATKIALAFEEQMVDTIPTEKHDVPMDIIVTEERVIR